MVQEFGEEWAKLQPLYRECWSPLMMALGRFVSSSGPLLEQMAEAGEPGRARCTSMLYTDCYMGMT